MVSLPWVPKMTAIDLLPAGQVGCFTDLGYMSAPVLHSGQGREMDGKLSSINLFGSCWLPGCWAGSYDQGGDERAEQGFAATACVVHILKEAEVVRQLFLRDTAMRAEPGAQQGPETLDGVDVHLAEAIAVLVASVFTLCVADCLVLIAPG